jgi:23S rRNA (cytidine1920-2'-O)/16S rRNA (cytidine1409-2'-O)-methyltransferase
VRRRLSSTREQARAAIVAGNVLVGGAPTTKPARLVSPAEAIEVQGAGPRFVSRAGHKLDAALTRFDVAVEGRRALDAGASTGGFTQCLLERGAERVVAVDVGRNQLHERLRRNPSVEVHEGCNVRTLAPGDLGPPFPLVVADLSFISLVTVSAALVGQCSPGADMVLLVKPQFEAGRQEASRGRGVIRDPLVWRGALERVCAGLAHEGVDVVAAMASPLRGASGNVEFLVHGRVPAVGASHARATTVTDLIDTALDEAATIAGARTEEEADG